MAFKISAYSDFFSSKFQIKVKTRNLYCQPEKNQTECGYSQEKVIIKKQETEKDIKIGEKIELRKSCSPADRVMKKINNTEIGQDIDKQ